MRRQIGCLLTVLALMISGIVPKAGVRAQNAPPAEPDSFTFLNITDTHQGAGEPNANLRKLAEDAAQMSPKPAFVIHTGDVTDSGKPEEYARFKEATAPLREAGIKIYAVPGNHDVRWSPDGKEGFAREFGKAYQSFDHGGAHFLLLDTSVALEHWGHLDKAELDWLARDLKKVKPETPTFVFMHHWIGRDTPDTRMVDNEYDLINQLRNRNVVAIFTGHNHKDLAWQTSGIRTLMAEALFMPHGSYYRVNVSKLLVTIDRQFANTPGEGFHATLPIARQSRPSRLKAEWDDPDKPLPVAPPPAGQPEPPRRHRQS